MTLSSASAADDISISRRGVVEPDAELKAFVGQFEAAITAKKPDYKKIGKMFAPKVTTFQRSLDPLQPWNKTEPLTGDYLDGIIDIIVEQAPLPDDQPQPDYRPDALAMMAMMLDAGPLGEVKELPGAVCAPAQWSYDAAKVKAFAKKSDTGVSGMRFYKEDTPLFAKPKKGAKQAAMLPAYTLVAWDSPMDEPDNWMRVVSASGLEGHIADTDSNEGTYLSQMHVCFGKVSGKYKITGIFGYGL